MSDATVMSGSAGVSGRYRRPPRLLLLGDTRRVGHHGSSAVVNVIISQFDRRGVDIVSSIGRPDLVPDLRADSVGQAAALRGRSIDGIVINGEGAFHGRSKHALHFAGIAAAAHAAGLPCFVLNSVLDECDPEVLEGLRLARAMFCREGRSKARADAAGIPAILCPDLTFALEMPSGLTWRPGEQVFVTDTTVAKKNRALHAFAMRNSFQFLPLRGRPDIVAYGDRKSVIRAASFGLRHRLGRLLRGRFQADRYGCAEPELYGFLSRISRDTRLVISGRFHGVCLCLKLGVPFLAVSSNTYKIEGMLEDAGFADRMLALEALDADPAAIQATLADSRWSDEDERRRRAYLEAAERAIKLCFDQIAAAVQVR